MKAIAIMLAAFVLISSLVLAVPDKKISNLTVQVSNENKTQERGNGLINAISHVPDFVAQKLAYMKQLFASGTKGIGQALSDWIHSFFKPVMKSNQTENGTE